MDWVRVASSTYSKWPPTGNPLAKRVILIDSEPSIFWIYKAVASPSILASVATISSDVDFTLSNSESTCKSSGPIPSNGDKSPPNT